MLRKFEVSALITFLGLSSLLFADQITLKNGDRLTGTVVKSKRWSCTPTQPETSLFSLRRSRRSRPTSSCT